MYRSGEEVRTHLLSTPTLGDKDPQLVEVDILACEADDAEISAGDVEGLPGGVGGVVALGPGVTDEVWGEGIGAGVDGCEASEELTLLVQLLHVLEGDRVRVGHGGLGQ